MNDAQVYEVMRQRLSEWIYAPGKKIAPDSLASTLDVSVASVRKACNRLAAEGWLIAVSEGHYLAWRPAEEGIEQQHDVARGLLLSSLDSMDSSQPVNSGHRSRVLRIRKLVLEHPPDDRLIAIATGGLFAEIVGLSDDSKAFQMITGSNGRLVYLRRHESERIKESAQELVELCDMTLGRRPVELRVAIDKYFDRRRDLLRKLLSYLAA